MIRMIEHKGELIAILITHDHSKPGLDFVTPKDITLQFGYMKHPAGYRIFPHVHFPVERKVSYTLEAVMIRSGRVLVDIYDNKKGFVCTQELVAGDAILFVTGGHGFKFLEEGEMIEVKQGPWVPQELDKEKFKGELDKE